MINFISQHTYDIALECLQYVIYLCVFLACWYFTKKTKDKQKKD